MGENLTVKREENSEDNEKINPFKLIVLYLNPLNKKIMFQLIIFVIWVIGGTFLYYGFNYTQMTSQLIDFDIPLQDISYIWWTGFVLLGIGLIVLIFAPLKPILQKNQNLKSEYQINLTTAKELFQKRKYQEVKEQVADYLHQVNANQINIDTKELSDILKNTEIHLVIIQNIKKIQGFLEKREFGRGRSEFLSTNGLINNNLEIISPVLLEQFETLFSQLEFS